MKGMARWMKLMNRGVCGVRRLGGERWTGTRLGGVDGVGYQRLRLRLRVCG